ncbi:hypothetical protein DERP_014347 [Dermatophagoides pteronyssinus]|uniref:Uncharacterized protein n=1 Tax=Dermatophagoides pteronyssinus TaxID=6956 RepID=A0ABQ8JWV1_DERPT|nr:hypothetical protein DERP_014344 [Dermatophagoides pteronyssinus]KAH9427088.1 hypothetical protein DERP_014347 [Dermatophagoides pteronyssinus]
MNKIHINHSHHRSLQFHYDNDNVNGQITSTNILSLEEKKITHSLLLINAIIVRSCFIRCYNYQQFLIN